MQYYYTHNVIINNRNIARALEVGRNERRASLDSERAAEIASTNMALNKYIEMLSLYVYIYIYIAYISLSLYTYIYIYTYVAEASILSGLRTSQARQCLFVLLPSFFVWASAEMTN